MTLLITPSHALDQKELLFWPVMQLRKIWHRLLTGCPTVALFLTGAFQLNLALANSPADPPIVINEIHYHPQSEDIREEYIELHNSGENSVSLVDWQLTGGVNFIFPDIRLAGKQYLVVAANLPIFREKHPEAIQALGDWQGQLSNRSETIRLVNEKGRIINEVRYADDGDWATRIRDVVNWGHRGWIWSCLADGGGRSLELVNPLLPNNCGQNWLPSSTPNGTPGRQNSVLSLKNAPLIQEVCNNPVLPRSYEEVSIIARIQGGAKSISASVAYRHEGVGAFLHVPMWDDGAHGDMQANDGWFGANLPAQTNTTVVEFYLTAQDDSGLARRWPAPTLDDGDPQQVLNAMYQVLDMAAVTNKSSLWLILREADRAELRQINRSDPPAPFSTVEQNSSHAQFNGTVVFRDATGMQVRHLISIRNRGSSSRFKLPQSYRVNFLHSQPWREVAAVNLNSQFPHLQVAGSALYLHAGLPAAFSQPMRVLMNGRDQGESGPPSYGFYACNETIDADFAERHFPKDANGNIYKAKRYDLYGADFRYLGNNSDPYRINHFKQTNESEDDWDDLIELTRVVDQASNETYVQDIQRVLNVRMWMRYFALETLVDNRETNLGNGHMGYGLGDDYYLYFGVTDPRALIVPYDLDTIMGQGDDPGLTQDGLFRAATNARIARFLKHPAFVPIYYEELLCHMDHTFAPGVFHPLLNRAIGNLVPESHVASINQFMADRIQFIRSQIPLHLTVNVPWPQSGGYARTTNSMITLTGSANVIQCRSVQVNGLPTSWSSWEGRWTCSDISLLPGANRLTIRSLNAFGLELEKKELDIYYDGIQTQFASARIETNTTWKAGAGPYMVNTPTTVAPGVTLKIQSGVTVLFAENSMLRVEGSLLAEGAHNARIFLSRQPDSTGPWAGLAFSGKSESNRLAYVIIEGATHESAIVTSRGAPLCLDHVEFRQCIGRYVDVSDTMFSITGCTFPDGAFGNVMGQGIPSGQSCVLQFNHFGSVNGTDNTVQLHGINGSFAYILDNDFQGVGGRHLALNNLESLVEGNLFRATKSVPASASTAAALSIKLDTPTSRIMVVRNVAVDCDCFLQTLASGEIWLQHNTVFRNPILFSLPAQPSETQPSSILIEDNIFWDTIRNVAGSTMAASSNIVFRQNILTATDHADPHLNFIGIDPAFINPPIAGTGCTALREDFILKPNSPAIKAGSFGLDIGATAAPWAVVNGFPIGQTINTSARIYVGGPAITHYRYRLNNASYSQTHPITVPITLENLPIGSNQICVLGQKAGRIWQDSETPTMSSLWEVTSTALTPPKIRLNEILARNDHAININGGYPDLVELFNFGEDSIELTGLGLSDNASLPPRFVFPPGTSLAGGAYMIIVADNMSYGNYPTLGFNLKQAGGALYLFDRLDRGQILLDKIDFGRQIADLSIGRMADGEWALAEPTFGGKNRPHRLGDTANLRINEWQLGMLFDSTGDFVELFNGDVLPAPLSGLKLIPHNWPFSEKSSFSPLSFLGGGEIMVFESGSSVINNAQPWDYYLPCDHGLIGLFTDKDVLVDMVFYNPQMVGQSEGRSPNGSSLLAAFVQPTPGYGNQDPAKKHSLVLNEIFAASDPNLKSPLSTVDWIELHNVSQEPIDLSSYSLSDNPEAPARWLFPEKSVLAAQGFLVIQCNNLASVSSSNTGFGLKAEGDGVYLYSMANNQTSLIDAVVFGLQVTGLSIGLDMTQGQWTLNRLTPGAANESVTLDSARNLRINEWMAQAEQGSDWFELYNPGSHSVNLGGLLLTDNPNESRRFSIPPLSFIGTDSQAFVVFYADEQPSKGVNHVDFKLSGDGDSIALLSPDNQLIDAVSFTGQQKGLSQGRYPDGGYWIASTMPPASPGSSNRIPPEQEDLDQDGMPDGWEKAHGLNAQNPTDADADHDKDGLSNRQEFLCGTNPLEAASRFDFMTVQYRDRKIWVSFLAIAGKIYTVQYINKPGDDAWQTLIQFGPSLTNQRIEFADIIPPFRISRYYRLVLNMGASTSF